MLSTEQLAHLLDLIERAEDPLLSWGVVDGGLTEGELYELVEDWIRVSDVSLDADDVVDALVERRLVHTYIDRGSEYFRSRIGESVRLISRLRQMFLSSDAVSSRTWEGAATLVGGFRYMRRPRNYPDRAIDPRSMLEEIWPRDCIRKKIAESLTEGINLSGFQDRATKQILAAIETRRSSGVIIGAGTGSGKTLAFYLPAMAFMGDKASSEHWTKVLGVYPRVELLKDQLQSAVEQSQRIASVLAAEGRRPLRVGVLFGDVPHSFEVLKGQYGRWTARGMNFVCPYLRCPRAQSEGGHCRGELVLKPESMGSAMPWLECATCAFRLSSEEFALTRDQLRACPPDLLFTSAEMLNRALLNPALAPVVGIEVLRGPELVLLDEVHTYGGTSGAMTAMVLRRWRNRVRSRPVFVGLSATLTDAGPFFADLVGIDRNRVVDIHPTEQELVPEGAEYHIAVRSDPTSGAGTLSTTIQTAILVSRVMDPLGTWPSAGLYGNKVFCFTDNLDVTNRLYFDLLDAEGQRARARGADMPIKLSLAHLRSPEHGENLLRRQLGQVWDLSAELGHDLSRNGRLGIGRTSSQDSGVNPSKSVIVASSSLEVGFDDPSVGAVIQHKNPRDAASFIQRRGRAGRLRGMRPLTVVVLSDYGSDRLAYEQWDRLFAPILPARRLPVRNISVLRIQAALSTLEWVLEEVGSTQSGLWEDLSREPRSGSARRVQQSVAILVEKIFTEPNLQAELRAHLCRSLQIGEPVADELLWHPPRSILLAALPALLRRLQTNWTVVNSEGDVGNLSARHPLPEFIPPNLFTDLNLPEVEVHLPVGPPVNKEFRTEFMDLVQCVREFTPGRVSRRFTIESALDRHWIEPSETLDVGVVASLWRCEGTITVESPSGTTDVPLLRPVSLLTSQPPVDIKDSSNASPIWYSQFVPSGGGVHVSAASSDAVGRYVAAFTLHLHRDHSEVEVRRGSVGSNANVSYDGGRELRIRTTFTHEGAGVAIGSATEVDAIRADLVEVNCPDAWSGAHGPGLRSAWFYHLVISDETLLSVANVFQLIWLHDVLIGALASQALCTSSSLEEAWKVVEYDLHERLGEFLDLLVARPGLATTSGPVVGDGAPQRLRDNLRHLIADPIVLNRLRETVAALWELPRPAAHEWLSRRLRQTVGETMLAAAAKVSPAHSFDDAIVEIEPGFDEEQPRVGQVWLTETTIGGGGFLESVADELSSDPSRFQRLMRASLRPGPTERVGTVLERVLDAAINTPAMAQSFEACRTANSHRQRHRALIGLCAAMGEQGIHPMPESVSSVVNRLLLPGSDAVADRVTFESLQRWKNLEARLGIEVEQRVWTVLDATRDGVIDWPLLDHLRLVLWPRGWRIRADSISSRNQFAEGVPAAPEVLESMLASKGPAIVDLDSRCESAAAAVAELQSAGMVDVRVAPGLRGLLADFLASSIVVAVDAGFLQLYPRVARVRMESSGHIIASFDIPEVL
ncbi:protein DpdJ [Lolliginicoccus suaedae]|uniref:protein DpdJ n=1 Tax=Lolliginicoccus suaedae TaxID=2605429 RepID=UPI0011EF4CFA|nr:protein DpdJ [Lolliginicoccus suaedae]